jgi:hypothetical protein
MTSLEAVRVFLDVLEAEGVPHMIVGSLSSMFYGVSRSTKDADIVVELGDVPIDRIARQVAPPIILDRQMTFESVTGTTRYIFNVPEIAFKIEIFLLSHDPHDQQRFARRQCVYLPHLNREGSVPQPEDVIITKLRWARDSARGKDRDDVKDVIAARSMDLDWDYVHMWSDAHGTRKLLDEIRSEIPAGN